jgi:peptide/nickel transport system substrate-binding protein
MSLTLQSGISRRALMRGAGTAAAGLSAAALIGCGDSEQAPSTATAAPTPTTGGTASPTATVQPTPEGGPQPGGTLIAEHPEPTVTSLATAVNTSVSLMNDSFWDGLIIQGAEFKPELRLAERYEWNSDHTHLIVTLKPGLEFHNGKPITSEDVKKNVEWWSGSDSGANGAKAGTQVLAKGMKVVDNRTIEFRLDAPGPWINDAIVRMLIVDTDTVGQRSEMRVINGSGPFRLTSFRPQVGAELNRFANYHIDGQPYLDAVQTRYLPDQEARDLALMGGEIEWTIEVPETSIKRLRAAKGVQLALHPPGGMSGLNNLLMNITYPALQDPRVRRAIVFALDVDRIAEIWTEGLVPGQRIPFAEGSPGYRAAVAAGLDTRVKYDPDFAKSLLAEAGHANGLTIPMLVPGRHEREVLAQLIQQDLREVGIEVRFDIVEYAAYLDTMRKREVEALLPIPFGNAGTMHPASQFSGIILGIPNPSHQESDRFKTFIEQIRVTDPNSEAGQAMLRDFSEYYMYEEPWLAGISPNSSYRASRDHVHGWQTANNRVSPISEWWKS